MTACRTAVASVVSFAGLLVLGVSPAAAQPNPNPCDWESYWQRIVQHTNGRWSAEPPQAASQASPWTVRGSSALETTQHFSASPFPTHNTVGRAPADSGSEILQALEGIPNRVSLESGETLVVAALHPSDDGAQVGFREEGIRALDLTSGDRKWVFPRGTGYGVDIEPSAWWCGSDDPEACFEVRTDLSLQAMYLPTRIVPHGRNNARQPSRGSYSDSITAIDIDTGNVIWYFRFDHDDGQDDAPSCRPILLDADANGIERKLLVQPRGNHVPVFLDRETGAPIWSLMRASEAIR